MSLDTLLKMLNTTLQQEGEVARPNSLTERAESQLRRATINQHWQAIQAELAPIGKQIKDLPFLVPQNQIDWAQAALAMRGLAFMELDTTGLEATDEIIRFTLVESNLTTIDDFFIKPVGSQLSEKASHINGITPDQLERDGLPIAEVWPRIQAALAGRYIISYNQPWDLQQLKATAERHKLAPVLVIGDDLQRHCTSYYHRQYGLTLTELCERIGHPLPKHPHQTSLDRAKGQAHLMTAMANAVTDVRPIKLQASQDQLEIGGDGEGDDLDDLDAHPF